MPEPYKIFKIIRHLAQFPSAKQNEADPLVDPQAFIFNSRSSIFHPRSSILVLFLTVLLTGCRQDMHNQPKYRPLRPVEQIGTINDGRSARPQVDGTVARDDLRDDVEFYTGKIAGAQGAAAASVGQSNSSPGTSNPSPN